MASRTRREVVEAMGGGSNPFTQVFGIGKRCAEAHNADWGSLTLHQLAADGTHPGHNHL